MRISVAVKLYRRNAGFTVVELLVVIAIVGLLLALTLPAVARTRESARLVQCRNNLHQLGIAVHDYHETHGVFPIRWRPFVKLLPHLGQQPLYDVINKGGIPQTWGVSTYICPSDPEAFAASGHVSYLLNEGFGYQKYGANGLTKTWWDRSNWTRFADIADGASNTACMAERLIPVIPESNEQARITPRRHFWFVGTVLRQADELDQFLTSCRTARDIATPHFWASPMDYLQTDHGYNHMLSPNWPACHQGTPQIPVEPMESILPPSSEHSKGLNVLLVDGSVKFVSDSVNETTWRALGTRDQGDIVENAF